MIFLAYIISEIAKKYDNRKTFDFMSKYDINGLINQYQEKIDKLNQKNIVSPTEYKNKKDSIIESFKEKIINNIDEIPLRKHEAKIKEQKRITEDETPNEAEVKKENKTTEENETVQEQEIPDEDSIFADEETIENNIFKTQYNSYQLSLEEKNNEDIFENNENEIKEILESPTYNGYIYDVDLDQEILDAYKVGDFLYHPFSIFATSKLTKPTKNTRYFILSRNYNNVSINLLKPKYRNKGLMVNNSPDSCFKIIDKIKINGITQITLLNFDISEEQYIQTNGLKIEEIFLNESQRLFNKSFEEKAMKLVNINSNISTGIGLIKENGKIKNITKDQIMFILSLESTIIEKYTYYETMNVMRKQNLEKMINIFQEKYENTQLNPDEEYENKLEKAIELSKKEVLNKKTFDL